ncbi:homing endonuclease [Bacillus phage G]|uniref:Gp305 n=1 Tax=Bacillus phage G TaxID=2884420 RepID=G3MA46_9CAUD|nr:homing endonuclease [Bacillus phage G]AEO93564.1 gp305 [Bacillus phage G]
MYYGYIYRIHNKVNGFSYIGQTIQKKAEHRFNMHIKKLNDNKHHNYLLQKDWKKYGKDNFDFQIIQTLKYRYKDKLLYKINEAEIYFIQYFESMFDSYGYNLQIGGNNWQVLTKPVRERISSSLHANMLEKLKEQKEDLIKAYIDFNLGYKRSYVLNKYKISKHSLYSLQNKKGQPWKVIENDIEERIEPYRAIIHIHNNLKNNSGYKNCKLNLLELIEIDKLLRHKTMEKEQIANKYNISYSILEKISRRDSIYKYIFLEIENYEKKGI